MTKTTAQNLKRRRDHYIRLIQQRIQNKYPAAEFDVSRGPGHRWATIRVAVPIKDPLDVHNTLSGVWGDAAEDNFHFLVLPTRPEDR